MHKFKYVAMAIAGLTLAACMPTQAPTPEATTTPAGAQALTGASQSPDTAADVTPDEEQTSPPRARQAVARRSPTPLRQSLAAREGETPAERSRREMEANYRRWDSNANRALKSICSPC